MKRACSKVLALAILSTLLLSSASPARDKYQYDIPSDILNKPGNRAWGVTVLASRNGYRIRSITRLNGSDPINLSSVVINSGNSANWTWEIRAVTSLLPSLDAWRLDEKIALRSKGTDEWKHAATSWEQAMTRARYVVSYLLGHDPEPLHLQVLLIPENSRFKQNVTQHNQSSIPLSFTFYYPLSGAASEDDTNRRFAALLQVIATSMHEYQHVLSGISSIRPAGQRDVDRTINDEVRSHCWYNATHVVLTWGSHSVYRWDPTSSRKELLDVLAHRYPNPRTSDIVLTKVERRFSDASLWGEYLDESNTAAYLKFRGIENLSVHSNNPDEVNAVLSSCRAITQNPTDLTSQSYSPGLIGFVPLFSETEDKEK